MSTNCTAAGTVRVDWVRTAGNPQLFIDDWSHTHTAAPPAAVATLGYNADSQITTETLPDGNQTWTYANGRVTGLTQTLTGAAVTSAALGYDLTGRVGTRTVNGATTTFGYDLASQLRTITPASGAATT